MRDFRFGFTLGSPRKADELAETCRAAEAFGYDCATVVDHLGPGRLAPFQALVAAAHASQRLRVGTYVVNNGFWNAAMLAREVVTAVRLTGGRLDLGLGIGLIKASSTRPAYRSTGSRRGGRRCWRPSTRSTA